MAAEEKDSLGDDAAAGGGAPAASSSPKGPLILALAQTVLILATLGFFVYSRLLFKRPPITEEGERARLAAAQAVPKTAEIPGMIHFEEMTVNIKSNPETPKAADGAEQIQGKFHFAKLAFSLELRDIGRKDEVESLRPQILDRVLSLIGRKSFEELATVQGRYLLRTELLDSINDMMTARGEARATVVTNVYLTQFIVQ